jgi:Tubulin-tyrosine ligase family
MQRKFGKEHFDFVPTTFILPEEFPEFQEVFMKIKERDPKKNIWILKPANSSLGKGISIVDDLHDVVIEDTSVI